MGTSERGRVLDRNFTFSFEPSAAEPRAGQAEPARAVAAPRAGQTSVRPVVLATAAVPVLMALAMAIAGPLSPVLAATGRFLDFYAGVFALVSLSVAVMVGLLATDRWVLASRYRVRVQALHRAAAVTAVMMLTVHILSEVLRGRVGVLDVLVPFAGLRYGLSIELGTIACYLLIVAFGTGIARGWFAASAHPWVWRVLHCAAYAAWPLAIAHGLSAGRTPAEWVVSSYGLCLAAVVFAVAVRFLPRARAGRPR